MLMIPYSHPLENDSNQFNLGCRCFSYVFDGIPTKVTVEKRMATDAFNKVNGTENIYAIGDTCIQLTDAGFPNGHPQVAQVRFSKG
jgi:NADH dehydrogenase FAD-containing subunit